MKVRQVKIWHSTIYSKKQRDASYNVKWCKKSEYFILVLFTRKLKSALVFIVEQVMGELGRNWLAYCFVNRINGIKKSRGWGTMPPKGSLIFTRWSFLLVKHFGWKKCLLILQFFWPMFKQQIYNGLIR